MNRYYLIPTAAFFALATSAFAFKAASGILENPTTMTEMFGAGVTHHQTIDVTATGTGAASVAQLDAVAGLQVNYLWTGFERVENRLGVSNYLHFTGATAMDDRSIRLTTRFNSLNQTNWAGVGSTGGDPDGVMRVSGEHAWYVGPLGGSWTAAEIDFGRLTQISDDPAGNRNDSFTMDAGNGLTYGVQAVGFIVSNVLENQSFTATLYGYDGSVLTTLTGAGSETGVVGSGDEIFFGYAGGDNLNTWVSRVVLTGNNAGRNVGLDNLAFSPITAIPEPRTVGLVVGLIALGAVFIRRRR